MSKKPIKAEADSALLESVLEANKDFLDAHVEILDAEVEDQEDLEELGRVLQQIVRLKKEIEKERKAVVKPFKDKAASVDKKCRTYRVKLEALERGLKKLLSDYEERRRAEQQRLLEAAEVDEEDEEAVEEAEEALEKAHQSQPVKLSGISTRDIVDKEKIQAAVDSGVREIPGVRVFCVWTFEVEDSKAVPQQYRKVSVAAKTK